MKTQMMAKSLKLIKLNISQLKRTKSALEKEHYDWEANKIQGAISILTQMWNN